MGMDNPLNGTGLQYFWGKLKTILAGKVDKETGKGLSTEDYTTAEKTKLSGIETGAQKNSVTGVKGSNETAYRTGNVNLTAANVGALPITGGTLTGNLTVDPASGTPSFTLVSDEKEDVGAARSRLYKNASGTADYGTLLVDYAWGDASVNNDRAALILCRNISNLANALLLRWYTGNAYNAYRIYGEHNKPTPAALGAAAASHTHLTSEVTGLDTALARKAEYPIITEQPSDVRVSQVSEYAELSVTAVGNGLTYTWYYLDPGMEEYGTSSLNAPSIRFQVTAARNGRLMYCVVTDSSGNTAQTETVTISTASFTGDLDATDIPDGEWYLTTQASYTCQSMEDQGIVKPQYATFVQFRQATIRTQVIFCGNPATGGATILMRNRTGATLVWRPWRTYTHADATATARGYMTPAMVAKLAGIAEGADLTEIVDRLDSESFTAALSARQGQVLRDATRLADLGYESDLVWVPGNYSGSGGTGSSLYRCRTVPFWASEGTVISVASGHKFSIAAYSRWSSTTDFDQIGWRGMSGTAYTVPQDCLVGITVATTADDVLHDGTTINETGESAIAALTITPVGYTIKGGLRTLMDAWQGVLDAGPVILKQPQSVTVAQAGDTAVYRVEAIGNGLTYQWYYITPAGNAYASTNKSATYTFTVSADRHGRKVFCIVTDIAGNSVVTDRAGVSIETDSYGNVEDRVTALEKQTTALNNILAVAAADNGKILGVKDGRLQLLSLDELPLG